jgi:hypothetical protein
VIVDNPLLVVQDRGTFRFIYIREPEGEVADDLVYKGGIQTVEGSDQFEAMAGICGGDYKAEEIVRLQRGETSETAARFDAASIFFTDDFPAFRGTLDFVTCKWAYTRVSTELARRAEVPATRHPPDQTIKVMDRQFPGQVFIARPLALRCSARDYLRRVSRQPPQRTRP